MNGMILGLRGDHRLLYPAQKLPRLGQCQSKICDISEIAELAEPQTSRLRSAPSARVSTKRTTQPIRAPQPATIRRVVPLPHSSPQFPDTPIIHPYALPDYSAVSK